MPQTRTSLWQWRSIAAVRAIRNAFMWPGWHKLWLAVVHLDALMTVLGWTVLQCFGTLQRLTLWPLCSPNQTKPACACTKAVYAWLSTDPSRTQLPSWQGRRQLHQPAPWGPHEQPGGPALHGAHRRHSLALTGYVPATKLQHPQSKHLTLSRCLPCMQVFPALLQ